MEWDQELRDNSKENSSNTGLEDLGQLEEETVQVETLLEAGVAFGSGREQECLGEEERNALGYEPQSGGNKGVEAGKGGKFDG